MDNPILFCLAQRSPAMAIWRSLTSRELLAYDRMGAIAKSSSHREMLSCVRSRKPEFRVRTLTAVRVYRSPHREKVSCFRAPHNPKGSHASAQRSPS